LVEPVCELVWDWAQFMETQKASSRHASADHLVREAILFTVFS